MADAKLYALSAADSDRGIAGLIARDPALFPDAARGVDGLERIRMSLSRHASQRDDYRTAALVEWALARNRELEEEIDRALSASPVDVEGAQLANALAERLHAAFVRLLPIMAGILQRAIKRIEASAE